MLAVLCLNRFMSLIQLQPYLEAARTSLQEQSGRVTSGRVRVLAMLLKAGFKLPAGEAVQAAIKVFDKA
ncbi:MAG: hypothetical protein J0I36_04360, partial [Pandoraea sp.]|nr:hypothetical protein [Pandoraea sp.]